MTYEVLARKWRPRQFADVVGQDHVTRTLENALKTGRVAHAYLFVGPRGTGKTSIARIFAKALNCVEGVTTTPCDSCSSCIEIAAGTNLDVQEIDGASNRGIDDIRTLRDNVKYMPTGRHRVFIIDEVHMLSVDAFNALLKTLEEPPPHVKFLFATTEPQKLPLTIISRCQRFDLRRISVKLVSERLAKIAEKENITADEQVLSALARAAEGSLRDAESSLDQLVSFKGNIVQEEDVLSVFGLVSGEAIEWLTSSVLKGDMPAVVELIGEFDNQGKDLQRLLVELLEHFINLLVFEQGGQAAVDSDLPAATVETLKSQVRLADADRLLRVIDVLIDAMDKLRYSLSKKALIEAALIKASRSSTMVPLAKILDQIRALKEELAGETSPALERNAGVEPAPSDLARVEPELDRKARAHNPDAELELLKENWRSLVENVGRVAVLAKNALLDARPLSVSEDQVLIGVDRQFAGRVQHIEVPRNLTVLRNELRRLLRRQVGVSCELVDLDKKATATNETIPRDGSSGGAKKGSELGSSPGEKKRKWMKNGTVIKTLDAFDGTIVDVKE